MRSITHAPNSLKTSDKEHVVAKHLQSQPVVPGCSPLSPQLEVDPNFLGSKLAARMPALVEVILDLRAGKLVLFVESSKNDNLAMPARSEHLLHPPRPQSFNQEVLPVGLPAPSWVSPLGVFLQRVDLRADRASHFPPAAAPPYYAASQQLVGPARNCIAPKTVPGSM